MSNLDEQLAGYLADAHSIEEQALVQMRMAPGIAGSVRLSEIFRDHLTETEEHERLIRERLEARGAGRSVFKGAVMKAGGVGFALFARLQPDTPGKLTAHAYSYEHLELAGYELLLRVAERAGDAQTAEVAGRIRAQERAMAERLEASFDEAVDASLTAVGAEDLDEQLIKYLTDAHALEAQAIELLGRGPSMAGDHELEQIYADHLDESRAQQRLVEERLEAKGGKPNALKDAAMRLGALNWGTFFKAHPDTPGKLAAFAYAFEHLEIAGYELLKRVAQRAGDPETVAMAEEILPQERAAAERIAANWDRAASLALAAQGVTA